MTHRSLRARSAPHTLAWTTWMVFTFGLAFGCASENPDTSSTGTGGTGGVPIITTVASSSASGTGGEGGHGICAQDCSKIQTATCLKAVCNDGSYQGTYGDCVVVPDDGASCDDGQFCTVNDTCLNGQCMGGPQNTCGMTPPDCTLITCVEATQSCSTAPAGEGDACTPVGDLCQVNGSCHNGLCTGTPKDCSFSPYTECNSVACNPSSGMCEPTPDAGKNGNACNLTGDLCAVGKTCNAGTCQGGSAKDCSMLTHDCVEGQCNPGNGACMANPIAQGGMCSAATNQCNQGICDAMGMCNPMPLADGSPCEDWNLCTSGNTCVSGACGGSPIQGCTTYYAESFETCPPPGWTLTGDWQCGVATDITPPAQDGTKVVGLVLTGNYNNGDTYANTIATSPSIYLLPGSSPHLTFRMFVDSEGSVYDGTHLEISQDGGAFQTVGSGSTCTAANMCTMLPVSKPYTLTIGGAPAWGGVETSLGWQPVDVDLSSYVGHYVQFRFPFHSDTSVSYPGIYLDHVLITDSVAIPLDITTTTVSDAFVGQPYAANLARTGGTANAVWSIVGGTNDAWISIDPMTGALSGTPAMANVGPVTVTVQVQEPSLPSNLDQQTFNFTVGQAVYVQGFEGTCPDGWTLTGDWQCGVPSSVGPTTAYAGTQCIGTVINGDYNDGNDYTTTTATSPAISLAGTTSPTLTFHVWDQTETCCDGFNLKISTDGGATYSLVTTTMPAYNTSVNSESCWNQNTTGTTWQTFTADLSAYAGQSVLIRFAFRSDSSVTYPGVYIDDVIVSD